MLEMGKKDMQSSGDPILSSSTSPADQTLVERIRQGDRVAFERLFYKHHQALFQFALSILRSREYASDIIQDVFLKIWRNRQDWYIKVDVNVYLYQAVRNQSLNLLQSHKARYQLEKRFLDELQIAPEWIPEEPELDEKKSYQIKQIWRIVETMPEKRRMVFHLHKKHGLNYQEIAQVCEISVRTVENHIAQSLHYIRAELEEVSLLEKKFLL